MQRALMGDWAGRRVHRPDLSNLRVDSV